MKKQGRISIIGIIIIFAIIVLSLIAALVYVIGENKGLNNSLADIKNEEKQEENSNVVEDAPVINTEENESNDANSQTNSVPQEKEDKFAVYADNIKKLYEKNFQTNSFFKIYEIIANSSEDAYSIEIDKAYDAYINFKSDSEIAKKYGKKVKAAENVMYATYCNVGNGGYGHFIFIHFNGSVSILNGIDLYKTEVDMYENAQITLEPAAGLKDIVNVIKVGLGMGTTYFFVDIEGNTHYYSTGK